MTSDMTGQTVLTRDEDGLFCIGTDAGPLLGTDPILQVRKVERITRTCLDARDPQVKSILSGGSYAAGYTTGHLYAIDAEVGRLLIERGRLPERARP